jgi:glycosyltransferase involved in cell wall biosynthesis
MRLEVEQMAKDLDITASVTFLGAVSRTWIKTHCSQYAAMVLPFCQVRGGIMDTGPLVIKEALALRLPLLTTDIMATGEFVDSSCAFVSKSSDPEDLARTLLKLLIALNYVRPGDMDMDVDFEALKMKLGPRIEEIRSLLLQTEPSDIIAKKVECGFQKVMTQFSSKQQGSSLSILFQAYGVQ